MATVKSVTVRYAFIGNNPRNRAVDKVMEKWLSDGYTLQSRTEHPSSCFELLVTAGWHRGHTTLTFVHD